MNDRPIKVIKKADKPEVRPGDYLRRDVDSLLHTLIEMDFDRAKQIIEKIAASKRHQAA